MASDRARNGRTTSPRRSQAGGKNGNSSSRGGKTGDKRGRKSAKRKAGSNREWTEFEMQTVLALICKRVHLRKGGVLTFATALNEALNGRVGQRRGTMEDDVDVEDVDALLAWIYKEKKGAL